MIEMGDLIVLSSFSRFFRFGEKGMPPKRKIKIKRNENDF
jgi:hypothetical protein